MSARGKGGGSGRAAQLAVLRAVPRLPPGAAGPGPDRRLEVRRRAVHRHVRRAALLHHRGLPPLLLPPQLPAGPGEAVRDGVRGNDGIAEGPLWWAGHHRRNHRYADTGLDPFFPSRGFWWSHVGWALCDKYSPTAFDAIRDFAKYPELRFLNRRDWIGPWALGIGCFRLGGSSGLLAGFWQRCASRCGPPPERPRRCPSSTPDSGHLGLNLHWNDGRTTGI